MPVLPGVSVIEEIDRTSFDGYVRDQAHDLDLISGRDLDRLAERFDIYREWSDPIMTDDIDGGRVRGRYRYSEPDESLRRRVLRVIENPASYTYTVGSTYARSMANPGWDRIAHLDETLINFKKVESQLKDLLIGRIKSSWERLGTLDIDNHTVSRRSMNASVLEPIL